MQVCISTLFCSALLLPSQVGSLPAPMEPVSGLIGKSWTSVASDFSAFTRIPWRQQEMRYGKVFLSAAQHCFPSTANCTLASSGQNHPHVKSFGDGVQKKRTESLPKPFLLLKHNCIQWKRAREKDFFLLWTCLAKKQAFKKDSIVVPR